ncbi:hypothetical protein BDV26DRAFT_296759 [Aspergillus bertholletiae]|uniref:Uncharacterized protein n=1 Tax=Aspergillus bertholletiae TaxID=1226010 RepID=A0A5N7AUX2_9EURO|nr:hypothetical protein BDV26DRAFT_296759 [Aspergillus bertholletiae]
MKPLIVRVPGDFKKELGSNLSFAKAEAEEKSSLLREGLDEQCRTMSAEAEKKPSPRKGYQKLMSSGVEERSSLCQIPKVPAAGGKTWRGKKAQQVPSNQLSILSFVRRAEEAGEKPELPETGCTTAEKHPSPTEAGAEESSKSKKTKLIKESVEYTDSSISVKTDEESTFALHDIPESKVHFNPEAFADVILIDDEECPDELKYEDAAGYDVETQDDLLEQEYQEEAGYLEEGFVTDEDRYRAAGITSDEDREALRESFDKSMHRVIKYLCNYAQSTPFSELSDHESWVAKGLYQYLRGTDPEVVFRLYQMIIPESTHTILGHGGLTGRHILALPKACPWRREKGVYLDYVSSPHEAGGLYTGSTKAHFIKRILDHKREIQRIGPRTNPSVHYKYIREKRGRKSHFRVVAAFPQNLPELGIERADSEWLIRLLGTAIMIVLDTFQPGSLPQFSVSQDRLDHLRSECGLRPTVFYPLNRALPTKQSGRSNIPRPPASATRVINGKEHTVRTGLLPFIIGFMNQPLGHAATQTVVLQKQQGNGTGTAETEI